MAFILENFGAEVANAKGTLGGICYYRYFNENGDTLTNSGYFPANLGLNVGDRIRVIPKTNTDADEVYIVTSIANRTVTVKQVDTDGAVDSVNGKTGAVVLDASDVGALPSSTVIPAAQVNSDWNANSGVAEILNKPTIPDAVQYSTMPTASADNLGDIVQFTGTTDATYTNGYFYKCVSDGQEPATYSWTAVQVQAGGGGGSYTAGTGIDITGTTISTDVPMATVSTSADAPSATAASGNTGTIAIGAGSMAGGSYSGNNSIAIGENANAKDNLSGNYNVAIGGSATARAAATAVGYAAYGAHHSVAIGDNMCSYNGGVIIGSADSQVIGTGKGCFDVVLYNDQTYTSTLYNILDINGILAADRLASTTGLADGNYRLRLTMASGVPTLSWVAE